MVIEISAKNPNLVLHIMYGIGSHFKYLTILLYDDKIVHERRKICESQLFKFLDSRLFINFQINELNLVRIALFINKLKMWLYFFVAEWFKNF